MERSVGMMEGVFWNIKYISLHSLIVPDGLYTINICNMGYTALKDYQAIQHTSAPTSGLLLPNLNKPLRFRIQTELYTYALEFYGRELNLLNEKKSHNS
jgi:hypothetical protein